MGGNCAAVRDSTLANCSPFADPEGGGGGGAGGPDPPENHKNIGFPSNIGLDPLKSQSYQANIQCWAIIVLPAKRYQNGGSLAGR